MEREAALSGSYILKEDEKMIKSGMFNFSKIDTVKYDDINSLENQGIPFTTAEVPPEPFFSSLLEPAIAIGAAALTIYLFFNVRSK